MTHGARADRISGIDGVSEAVSGPKKASPSTTSRSESASGIRSDDASANAAAASGIVPPSSAEGGSSRDPRTTASRLYSGVPLCSFCAQLARPDPEEDEDDAPAAEADPEDDVVKPSSFLRSFLPEDRQAKYR